MTDITMGVCDHGLKCCPHTVIGMIVAGSSKTMYDGLPAARFGDLTISNCPHCGGAGGMVLGNTPKNQIDGRSGQKINDPVKEPFGMSIIITESPTCKDG